MKPILNGLLYSLCIMLSCSGTSKEAAPVQEYYKDSVLVARLHDNLESLDSQNGIKIALVPDWDKVCAYDLGVAGSARIVMGALTFKETCSAICKHGRILLGAAIHQGFRDENGTKLVGTGSNIRFLAEKIPALKTHYPKIITALGYAKPIKPMIELFQTLQTRYDLPIIVWTNNDKEVFAIKHENLNTALHAEGLSPFMLKGAFYGGQQMEGVAQEQYCVGGKPRHHYYKKALAYTANIIGADGSWIYVFVDDKAKNVNAARNYAKKTGAPLIAVQRRDDTQCKNEMEWLFGEKIC